MGGDGDVGFGGELDPGLGTAIQMLDGAMPFAMVNRKPWGRSDYDETRTNFINRIAAIYSDDITLV